jgi:ABC-type antimicrobial peptide transport system permease subunit
VQLRATVPPGSLSTRLQREIRDIDPALAISDLRTMNQSLNGGQGFLLSKIGALLAGAMGALGMVLAVIGVYGVVSYGAAQRTREIGIRIALGATPNSILGITLKQGVRLVAIGLIVGIAGATALSRVLKGLLLLESATDAMTFAIVSTVLAIVAFVACYIPARRTLKIGPMNALRHE